MKYSARKTTLRAKDRKECRQACPDTGPSVLQSLVTAEFTKSLKDLCVNLVASARNICLILGLVITSFTTQAQSRVLLDSVEQDSLIEIIILESNKAILSAKSDGAQYLSGNVVAYHDSSFLYCDSAILYANDLVSIGDVVLLRGDSIEVYGDSMRYDGDSAVAEVFGEVVMRIGQREIFTEYLHFDRRNDLVVFSGNSILVDDQGKIYCHRGSYRLDSGIFEVADSVFVDSDSLKVITDTLRYNTKEELVLFEAYTEILLPDAEVTCSDGYFDYGRNFAHLKGDPVFRDNEKEARADIIEYDLRSEEIKLIGNGSYISTDVTARGDLIKYNQETGDGEIIGSGYVNSDGSIMQGEVLKFNSEKEEFESDQRTEYNDDKISLIADRMKYAKEGTGPGYAYGDVIYKDTSSGITILSDSVLFNEATDYVFAYGSRPLMKLEMEPGDTLYLSADTLITEKIGPDSVRYFNTFQNTRFFSEDIQGVCDSLSFNERDSVFEFWGSPVIWLDSTQLKADTIQMVLKNKKADQLILRKNSTIISLLEDPYYQQIKGQDIDGFFKEDKLSLVDVRRNAESIYYMTNDENELMGVNRSICSRIQVMFEENEIDDIAFITNPELKFYPMKRYEHASNRLAGFIWLYYLKPQTINDLRNENL